MRSYREDDIENFHIDSLEPTRRKDDKVFFPHYTHVNHVSKRKREKAKRKMEKPKEKNHDLNKELQSVLQRQLCSYEL
jgi:hypothetical protein